MVAKVNIYIEFGLPIPPTSNINAITAKLNNEGLQPTLKWLTEWQIKSRAKELAEYKVMFDDIRQKWINDGVIKK